MPIYKCVVEACPNRDSPTDQTVFVCIPKKNPLRSKWLTLCKRDLAPLTQAMVCEKHFNMEQDFENYLFVKLMGGQLKKRVDTVPSKFPWNNWGEMKTSEECPGSNRNGSIIQEKTDNMPKVRDFGVFCNLDSMKRYCDKSVQTEGVNSNYSENTNAEESISSPMDICEVVLNN